MANSESVTPARAHPRRKSEPTQPGLQFPVDPNMLAERNQMEPFGAGVTTATDNWDLATRRNAHPRRKSEPTLIGKPSIHKLSTRAQLRHPEHCGAGETTPTPKLDSEQLQATR